MHVCNVKVLSLTCRSHGKSHITGCQTQLQPEFQLLGFRMAQAVILSMSSTLLAKRANGSVGCSTRRIHACHRMIFANQADHHAQAM